MPKTFTRITTGAIVNDGGLSEGSSWGDYDNDGDLDLFVANFGDNFLYENNGDGTFARITTGAIVHDSAFSAGSSWGDFDNDGDLDLFVANSGENNFLYQNNSDGTFTRITTGAIVTDGGNSYGSSWGDFDNDGDLDLFVANFSGENNFLYQNNGDGTFTRITTGAIVNDGGDSRGSSWADFDNDGDLDLFVANNEENNFLYQNDGSTNNWLTIKCVGTFSNRSAIGTRVLVKAMIRNRPVWQMREISGQTGYNGQNSLEAEFGLGNASSVDSIKIVWPSGSVSTRSDLTVNQHLVIQEEPFVAVTTGVIVNDGGNSRGSSWADFDNDGDLDLYVANDGDNFLYQNNGDGTFTKITTGDIVNDGGDSYGISWGDFDNDGDLDLFIANSGDNFLYLNKGDGSFTKITAGAIVTDGGNSRGWSWGDFDNNGDLDLFIANSFGEDNFLYQNNGDGTFAKITTGAIVNDGGNSDGGSWGDFDNDGDLDLFVANYNEDNFLYQNNGFNHNWLSIKCVGTFSNRSAIGTKVLVKALIRNRPVWQMQEISDQNNLEAEFGLGNATTVDSVKILWPSGTIQILTDIQPNQFLTVTEIQPLVAEHTPLFFSEAGQNVLLATTVSGDIISEVSINFRQGGESQFLSVLMSDTGGGNLFEGTIPAGEITSRGLEYHIIATDIHSNTVKLPSQGNYPVRIHVNEGIKRGQSQPHGGEEIAYRLFSVPLELDDQSPEAVFADDLGGYDDTKWRLLELLENQTFKEFLDINEIKSGKSYWLIVTEPDKTIDTGAGTSILTSEEFPIVLHPEWNLIGNPFNFPILVETMRLASRDLITLRTYTGNWNDLANPILRMFPFEGYAVFNDTSVVDTLFINPDLSIPSSSLTKTVNANSEQNIKWRVHIKAQCQKAQDIDNIAAVASGASNAWDTKDLPEPPVIGEYVSVYFPHHEWQKLSKRFCTDFRPEFSDGEIWEFKVKTNIPDKVHLTFEGVTGVPKEFEIWLVDEAVNVTRNLREANHYAVAGSESHPKRLKLVVGKSDFVGNELAQIQNIPTDFELSQNFPNPFNPATTIRYGLPKKERVTLKVYNILGAEVVTLVDNELRTAGYHSAIWDSRNNSNRQVASGLYFLQMRAGKFVQTRKMLLIE